MECLRCGNREKMYFYEDRGVWYCRKCIAFGRINVGEMPKTKRYHKVYCETPPHLRYDLTLYQKEVVAQMLAHLKRKQDVLVYAATGAGKTEIAMMAIHTYLKQGKKVGFAISRRQVVLEIQERLQDAFPSLHVVAVCEGHTRVVDGDIIVCTMHQLYRYVNTFSLLLLDEVDAFPYRGNAVLEKIAMQACKGEKVYLTATPDAMMQKAVQEGRLQKVELFVRPHAKPLVVPRIVVLPYGLQLCVLFWLLHKKRKAKKQVLVFVPTIAQANALAKWFRLGFKTHSFTSKTLYKESILQDFKQGKYDFLICTTVLERGITIAGVDVVVLQSEHVLFHEASLIQIVGRVGRSMKCPSGEAWLFCFSKSEAIKNCVHMIKGMNQRGGV